MQRSGSGAMPLWLGAQISRKLDEFAVKRARPKKPCRPTRSVEAGFLLANSVNFAFGVRYNISNAAMGRTGNRRATERARLATLSASHDLGRDVPPADRLITASASPDRRSPNYLL